MTDEEVEKMLASLKGRRIRSVDARNAAVSVTFNFDDGSVLTLDAEASYGSGRLEYELNEPGKETGA